MLNKSFVQRVEFYRIILFVQHTKKEILKNDKVTFKVDTSNRSDTNKVAKPLNNHHKECI